MTEVWTREEAAARLVAWHGLDHWQGGGLVGLLARARCVQIDPLDRIGTNVDLVAMARVPGARRGDLNRALLGVHAFEHFAKERCVLPAEAFPYYRREQAAAGWWRDDERAARVDEGLVADVLAEVRARGPLTSSQLGDRGRVAPIDWSGWKGTSKASLMALELLWRRCEVVVVARDGNTRWFDVPERALPAHHDAEPAGPFDRWALVERVRAAGLLDRSAGPTWSVLREVRTSRLPDALVAEGALVEVRVEGWRRPLLAAPAFLEVTPRFDDDLRVLGPLDALLWDRALVEHLFGFRYVWEVYKPASQREWGWYVCPILHRGRLVGRLEAHREGGEVVIDRLWDEGGVDGAALEGWRARSA